METGSYRHPLQSSYHDKNIKLITFQFDVGFEFFMYDSSLRTLRSILGDLVILKSVLNCNSLDRLVENLAILTKL